MRHRFTQAGTAIGCHADVLDGEPAAELERQAGLAGGWAVWMLYGA
jgi:hypothetical protein